MSTSHSTAMAHMGFPDLVATPREATYVYTTQPPPPRRSSGGSLTRLLPSPYLHTRSRRRNTIRISRVRSSQVASSNRTPSSESSQAPRSSNDRRRLKDPDRRGWSISRFRSLHSILTGRATSKPTPGTSSKQDCTRVRRPSPATLEEVSRRINTLLLEEGDRSSHAGHMTRPTSMIALRSNFPPRGGPADTTPRRPHRTPTVSMIPSNRSPKSPTTTTQVFSPHKPVASNSSITCSIVLAEPNVYLSGFDHDGRTRREGHPGGTALLRGKMQLVVSKNTKIKTVQLKLAGKTRTEWPEGIPPLRLQEWEEESLRTQVLTFFDATNDVWQTTYGNQCAYSLVDTTPNPSNTDVSVHSSPFSAERRGGLSPKELKRLKLKTVRSRSFGLADPPPATRPTRRANPKGHKIFPPGTYEYSFELPIDHHQLETTRLPFGSVKWELQATVERPGAFRPNLHGSKELSIVRVPDQMSMETTEPIPISRQWDDQLHYDIVVSGKSFALGSKIPIAFKFTPLAKVQVYKIKVFLAESIEYWTNDRKVTRREPGRKILLLEKTAGKPMDTSLGAELRTTSGGELSPRERRNAREVAASRLAARQQQAAAGSSGDGAGSSAQGATIPPPSNNLLGDLDLGLESFWGPTEIEANVQIPTCEMMRRDNNLLLHPDSSWKNVTVDHWVKIVMRVSRSDPDDPNAKRRHFEISIDSPITLLNCRATQANTSLPEYSGLDRSRASSTNQRVCGCPDAAYVPSPNDSPRPPSSSSSLLQHLQSSRFVGGHHHHNTTNHSHARGTTPGGRPRPYSAIEPMGRMRPIHLIRVPSFGPPDFDADYPPPPADFDSNGGSILTPPPRYDTIVGTPSVDGLADYFARLAAHGNSPDASDTVAVAEEDDEEEADDDDEEDSDSDGITLKQSCSPQRLTERTGRVNVVNPRTPGGGRVPSRSLEIERPGMGFILGEPPAGRAVGA